MGNIKEAFEYAAKNPNSPFATNLKQLAAGSSLDAEAQKYGIDLAPFKPKPAPKVEDTPAPTEKSLGSKLLDTAKETGNKIGETTDNITSGKTSFPEGILQNAGNVAGGAIKAVGDVISSTPVVKDVVSAIAKPIGAGITAVQNWLSNNPIFQKAVTSETADQIATILDAHPNIAQDAEAINNIANAVLIAKGGTTSAVKGGEVAVKTGEVIADVAKTGADAVANGTKAVVSTVKPIVGGAVDITKMAGNGLARIPDRMATNLAEKQAVEATIKSLPSKAAQTAARDGIDIVDIKDLHALAPQNTALTQKLFKTVKDFAAGESKVDPIEIVGSPIVQRMKQLNVVRKEVGAKLGEASKNLGIVTKPELQTGVFERLKGVSGLQGLEMTPTGALNFAKTTLASTLSKADRKAIQEAFGQATKWGNGEKAHLFRQELFEILGGKKKSLQNITDTQEKAFEAIRSGLSDVLEVKNPVYKKLSNQYRKIVQPLGDMRKLMKNIDPNSTEDILNMSAGLLARRLTSAAPSNPIVRNILKGLDEATGAGKTQVNVENLQDLYNLLNKYYDIAPKTGFQNLTKEAHTATGVLDAAGNAIKNLAGNTNVVRQASLEKLLKQILSKSR